MPIREVVYATSVVEKVEQTALTEDVVSGGTETTTFTPFVYVMPIEQTTATIDHDLGRDPVAIQVLDEFGNVYDEYSVVYTIPNEQVRIGFDIPLKATIRMM